MNANTMIQEGGKGYSFGPVKCLMVEGDNGEFYPWYPEADRALDSLSVTQNGIYRASDRGVYGWNRVSVNVAQSDRVTGRDPETGQEVTVTADPETGELVETVVPVEIRVITPPTNPYGTYVDGQTITKDGMVVKAYDANGDEMQTVPIEEITINPTVAAFDPEKDMPGGYSSDIDTSPLTQPIPAGSTQIYDYLQPSVIRFVIEPFGGAEFIVGSPNPSNLWVIVASATSGGGVNIINKSNDSTTTVNASSYGNTAIGSVYYGGINISTSPININNTNLIREAYASLTNNIVSIAATLAHGERTPSGSPQTITASWPRPGDGAILETTFDILVGPRSGQGDD